MKKLAYDYFRCDAGKILEDSKRFLKVRAVISKAGVYQYDDGWALKPKKELLAAAPTARYAKIVLHNHPSSQVVMSKSQVFGAVEAPYFDRDKIRAVLSFDKQRVPSQLIQKIHDAVDQNLGLDNSIGFYYEYDPTPGYDMDVNTGKPRRYDYVMRDIFIDHVAVMFNGEVRGRCTYPNCGIGVDAIMRWFAEDKVVKRGSRWCVVHCHPDGSIGETIKCFPTEGEAEAMHRAIQAQKHGSTNKADNYDMYFARTDQDKRPPRDWWDSCVSKAESFASDPNRFCNWVWYEARGSLKSSMGTAAIPSQKGGIKEKMSLEEVYYPERSKEYNDCVKQRITEGMTRGEAEAHCAAATLPEHEAEPAGTAPTLQPSEHQTAEAQLKEPSPWDACIKEQMQNGMTSEEAAEACTNLGIQRTEGKAPEIPGAKPSGEDQLSDEETEIQRCVKNKMESEGVSEEEAREWCSAEKAGEHEAVDALIERGNTLLRLRQQRDIQRKRDARRYPLR